MSRCGFENVGLNNHETDLSKNPLLHSRKTLTVDPELAHIRNQALIRGPGIVSSCLPDPTLRPSLLPLLLHPRPNPWLQPQVRLRLPQVRDLPVPSPSPPTCQRAPGSLEKGPQFLHLPFVDPLIHPSQLGHEKSL